MRRPNILFLFPDQLRWDYVGYAGHTPTETPHLDELARDGVRFDHAIAPAPLCAPCRACIATGREYPRNPVPSNNIDLPLDADTLYRRLRDQAGYHVAGCGKFDLHKSTLAWNLDGSRCLADWGFSEGIDNEGKWDGVTSGREKPAGPYLRMLDERGLRERYIDDMDRRRPPKGHKLATHPCPLPDDAYGDNWVGANALKLLQRTPEGKPWFLQVNFPGPHDPWDVTETMKTWYAGTTFPAPHENDRDDPEAVNAVRRNYAAMTTNIDRWIGILKDALRERGELDNTLIIFASDHGEMLGDREAWGKTRPDRQSTQVPLVVWGPKIGIGRGLRHSGPATILDIAATVLEAAGSPIPSDWDSRSLGPALQGRAESYRDVAISGLKNWRMATDGRWKLVHWLNEDRFALYDLETDPQETTNLMGEAPEVEARLKAALSGGPSIT